MNSGLQIIENPFVKDILINNSGHAIQAVEKWNKCQQIIFI